GTIYNEQNRRTPRACCAKRPSNITQRAPDEKTDLFSMRRRNHHQTRCRLLGDDCLLWASDFPHEATRTDMRKLVKEHFVRKDLNREAKRRIIYDNTKRF